jgi:hypothetical protein
MTQCLLKISQDFEITSSRVILLGLNAPAGIGSACEEVGAYGFVVASEVAPAGSLGSGSGVMKGDSAGRDSAGSDGPEVKT